MLRIVWPVRTDVEKIAHNHGYPSIPLISGYLPANVTEALIAFYDKEGVLKTFSNLDPYLIIIFSRKQCTV